MGHRRTKSFILFLALCLSPLPVSADENVRVERMAEADWMIPAGKPNHFRWYYAWATEYTGAGDLPGSFVSVGTGRCTRERTKDFVMTRCLGERHAHSDISAFSMAPDASAAEIRFKSKGFVHRIRWTAKRPEPGMYQAWEGCSDVNGNEGQGWGGGLWRPARAKGSLFGQRVTRSNMWTELSAGAMVSQCSYVERSLTEGGRARMTLRVPR